MTDATFWSSVYTQYIAGIAVVATVGVVGIFKGWFPPIWRWMKRISAGIWSLAVRNFATPVWAYLAVAAVLTWGLWGEKSYTPFWIALVIVAALPFLSIRITRVPKPAAPAAPAEPPALTEYETAIMRMLGRRDGESINLHDIIRETGAVRLVVEQARNQLQQRDLISCWTTNIGWNCSLTDRGGKLVVERGWIRSHPKGMS